MNKRARNRLIGVTAIVLLIIVAIFASIGSRGGTAYYKTVEEVATDTALVGERVKVGGAVVAGSWDKKTNPMTFDIRERTNGRQGPDGRQGRLQRCGSVHVRRRRHGDRHGRPSPTASIEADEMITKCPSKYESAEGAIPVGDLVGRARRWSARPSRPPATSRPGTIVPRAVPALHRHHCETAGRRGHSGRVRGRAAERHDRRVGNRADRRGRGRRDVRRDERRARRKQQ